jgi:sulfatase maturation enzyme AslB (radical SAM superfamily)
MKQLWQLGRLLFQGRIPGQLIIQYTDHCNAGCPQCGMRVSNSFTRSRLTLEQTKGMIRTAAERNVAALSLTGGEPFLFLDDICALANYAGQQGIHYVRTGTNGFLFRNSGAADFSERMKKLADTLAETPLRNIWVSLDSSDVATHEQMRNLPGVVRGIEKALPIFAERGLFLSANLGINRNLAGASRAGENFNYDFFTMAFDRFYRFVTDLGFSIVNVCYPMYSEDCSETESANTAVYAATASDRVVYFSVEEKCALFSALRDTIPAHRDKIRIFTPRCSLHAMINQYEGRSELSSTCHGGRDFFFVDSQTGHVFPCGYRGDEDLGLMTQMDEQRCTIEDCRLCDWECFRDPSELFSPFVDLRKQPLRLLQRLRRDPQFFRLWKEDLLYYRACHYFNGRIPASHARLQAWQSVTVPA